MRTPERVPEAAKDAPPPANDRVVEQGQTDVRDMLEKLKLDAQTAPDPAPGQAQSESAQE